MNFKNSFLVLLVLMLTAVKYAYSQEPLVWKSNKEPLSAMAKLRTEIKAPSFKKKDFVITQFGAVGDGKTKNSKAFKLAIETCSKSGGGRVIVPAGVFLTGAIYLKSNVNLHLADDAKIIFSTAPGDYPIVLTRWEGMDCMNYSALIYAYGESNIAVTGNGILDGQADNTHWWNWNGNPRYGWKKGEGKQTAARTKLHELMRQKTDPKTRIFGEGHYLRPNMFSPYNCKNVLISGVKMINSPMWFIHPLLCENVIVEKVKVVSHGPNNDGCDPESCKNVLIKDCLFDTGDDCIAIKSGRDEDGRRVGRPAENHIIEGCQMKDGHGGVTIGSEIAGGASNIFAINCSMDSENLDRVLRLKTSSSRGGVIQNIFMKDIRVGSYKDAVISADMFYENPGNFIPVIRNIWVENVQVTKGGKYGVYIKAYQSSPVQNLRVVNSNFVGVSTPTRIDHASNLVFENLIINGQKITVPDSLLLK
ncbi:glycoside hydrolase family 28 protein [Pedobacter sp.]|uniref:glycoside hydrolase family 28 protein n=1 Tax=Pedobacter sp. TaxID=1411316 RepID=UPI003BAD3CF4